MTDEMYSLLGRYFAGQASAEEVVAVEKWKAESEENKAAFTELQSLWNRSEQTEAIVFDTNKAWNKVHSALQPAQQNQTTPPAKLIRFPLWKKAVAAAAILMLAAAAWLLFNSTRSNKANSIVADIDLKEVLLEDGSHVWLRKDSRLDDLRSFTKSNRELSFTGEAFFDIIKDPSHPFIINSGNAAVKVLGTSFTVTRNENRTEVIVKTGRVSLASMTDTSNKVIMEPGEKGVFENGRVSKLVNDDVNYISWQTDSLVFNRLSIPKVALAISRHYRVDVRIKKGDEAAIGEMKFTAVFYNQPLQAVFNAMEQTTEIQVIKMSEGVYEIRKKLAPVNK